MADLRATLTEKIAPLVAAIPGGEPQGIDASYEPDFEVVKAEIDKLGSLDGAQPAWGQVARGSEELLKTKTKDLRLSAWRTVALMVESGPQGLAEGMLGMLEVGRAHWDAMYPPLKRARARGNLASWISDQSEVALAGYTPKAADREALALCEALYGELDDFLTEKLGENYSGMGGLRGVLRNKTREVPAEQPAAPPPQAAPSPAQAQPAQAQPSASPAQAAPAPMAASGQLPTQVSSPEEVTRTLRDVGITLRAVARFVRQADATKVHGYRIHRASLWMALQNPPPNEGGKTRLPPPTPDKRKRIETLLASESWMQLLETMEDYSAQHLFWLDCQRYAALALDKLGPQYANAREVVGREVVHLLSMLPTLKDLKFADGEAFADAGTQAWLEEEAAKWGGGGGGNAAAAAASEEDQALAERFEQAKSMVSSGQVSDGLGVALALANRGADARTRFRARLSVARLALQGSQKSVARPILEGLALEVERHGLEAWEPELAARVYSSLLGCLNKDAKDAEEVAKFATLFDKLCRLDPAAAIALAG
ncbi:MAG: type VI secretion system protein TssA [Polyangiaceae bacterium]|nr:type VI secretion system protein TssA [Polyangiaceae bacterium]MCW5789244.1 type VI secretion system protein TssA [Polyangiaceae bacterium]